MVSTKMKPSVTKQHLTGILLHYVKGGHEWQPVISELTRYIVGSMLPLITMMF
jgi:hypothetical protein